ncbi:hypothetical protein [Micromonospora globbae]|uniref:hypothetical protein n=1 Tax=Micromonospora globbae TaxID=1894969 RepID=UPI003867A92F|nr:hypothetical protein OH732_00345 [Micromonospora globbae]
MAAFVSAATRTTFHALTLDRHQRAINEMLDDAAGQAGLGEDRQHVAAALAGLTLTLYDERQAAVDQARDLIIAVTELGVLAPAA